jgi:hypothetical protein
MIYRGLGIGDWGLGIGGWAQYPIPQSPIPNPQITLSKFLINSQKKILSNFVFIKFYI